MRPGLCCRRSWLIGALFLILTMSPGMALSQPADPVPRAGTAEPSAAEKRTSAAGAVSTPEEIAANVVAQKKRDQQKQIAIALFVLVGLALAWLVGFAVLWGIRTRRIVRQPLPPAPRGDDLWFLKKPIPHSPEEAPSQSPPSPTEQNDSDSGNRP